jgi:HPt (histidine-containing phosphotransfer) domain-containing protein
MKEELRPISIADPFARRLMSQYLERRVRDLKSLSEALDCSDFATIGHTAHKLYGSGSAYGLDEVTKLGGALEAAAEIRNSVAVAALIEELKRYLLCLRLT